MATATGIQWHIGCSGFHYKEWKEVFYPKGLKQQDWFAYYCRHFHTLELNNTFYRFPELPLLQNWFNKSPDDFIFSVKAPRVITHYKKFTDTISEVRDFYTVCRQGLQHKLGCLLFQLPPQLVYSDGLLQSILEQLDPSFQNVIEFRHRSWWQQEVYDALALNKISFCGISHPALPTEVIVNAPVVYYRFHGIPDLYYSSYNVAELGNVVQAIRSKTSVQQAFVYFNNTAAVAAINNARTVLEMTGQPSE